MSRRQDEFRLSCAISDYLKVVLPDDAVYTHIPNGENRPAATGARLKRMGVRPGMPDYAVAYDGRVGWLEVKGPRGGLSRSQQITFPALERAGQSIYVCRSIADVEAALLRWDIPLKGRTYPVAKAAQLFAK